MPKCIYGPDFLILFADQKMGQERTSPLTLLRTQLLPSGYLYHLRKYFSD
jgi:hypothetical protein